MTAAPRVRAVQQRAIDTRNALLDAAITLFVNQGYDATSMRQVETAAELKRGLAAYHFGSKQALWKAAATRLFEGIPQAPERIGADQAPDREVIRSGIVAFVTASAALPEINRLMMLEGKHGGWRSEFLVENFVRPRLAWVEAAFRRPLSAHELYVLIGASTFVFEIEHECRSLFGVDPRTPDFVRTHAEFIADLVLGGNPYGVHGAP